MHFRRFLPTVLLASALTAQAPSGPWATITTAHYRIHYPQQEGFPAFAQAVASRIEGIHAQYLAQTGWRFEGVQDVLLGDPAATANGSAWPFLKRPYVWLWATPPEEESVIGHHRGWEELLLVHELGHMHHLLRPQHGARWWEHFMDAAGPVARKAPRWVVEGYATVLEGRITGSGRPHSLQRAAVLRTWAREGRLPSYEGMSAASGFMGGSMAYLVGSAYLEWLEGEAHDPNALQTLWKQLASQRRRDFDASFVATFGFDSRTGYARFCAELSHDALREEARLQAAGLVEGEPFAKADGLVSDLALSPDGSRLLARVQGGKGPGLWVWDLLATEPKPKAPSTDPEEPVDVAPRVPLRRPRWVLPPQDGALARHPRWSADGGAVLFDQLRPDAEGVLRPHPRRWMPGAGVVDGAGPEAPRSLGIRRGESEGAWNLIDAEGRPLTRTLSALWSPTQVDPKGPCFAARLTATGTEVRRFAGLTPLPPAPPAAEPLRTEGTVRRREDAPSLLPPPVPPPPAHPYAVGETLQAFPVSGLQIGPSGTSFEAGLGFNDFLGRFNGFALGAAGDAAGPRGGAAALAWRGWPVALSLQVYSLLERPSRQPRVPATGLDRERRGAEWDATFTREGLTRLTVSARALTEQEARLSEDLTLHRRLVEVEADGLWRRSRGEWGLAFGASGRSTEGRTESLRWGRERWRGSLLVDTPWIDLRGQVEGGLLVGDASPADRFALGGAPTSLSPTAADGFRLTAPGLPAFLATGDRFRRLRGELFPGFGRFVLEHAAVWDAATSRPAYLRTAGWELDSADLGLPLERIQGLAGRISLHLGVYRILDGVLKDRTTASVGLSLRP